MTIRNREEAARAAEASQSASVGMCQLWTRTMFNAPSVGDRDGDGDADAVDGWNSEPLSARHTDRNPPRGTPVAFSGGSKGFGHRAVTLGGGKIRSTDMDGSRWAPGNVGTTTIADIERAMGVTYLGWSETISGIQIPLPPAPKPPKPKNNRVTKARKLLAKAMWRAKRDGKKTRFEKLKKALKIAPKD